MSTEHTDNTAAYERLALPVVVASVWLVHGVYNKLLHGSPRHLAIVQSVPGLAGTAGEHALLAVAVFEIAVACWVLSGRAAIACASVQTVVLLSMNVIELRVARPLLLWPAGLIPLNLGFLSLAWIAALQRTQVPLRAWLRRHPVAIDARLENCLTLTYALPPRVLEPFVPPGLELETYGGYGFIAVALVEARSLRPTGLPRVLGQDFFLAGYRVFTTGRLAGSSSRPMRGLRILRTDTDCARMVAGGNLLTHYNYHRCRPRIVTEGSRSHVSARTADGAGDLEVTADLSRPTLPAGSPFPSVREARRFAGPLPFTFEYEPETHSIIAIGARRTNWQPRPVTVDAHHIAFFDDPRFEGCTPILAAAFHVSGVEYRWDRGVRYPIAPIEGLRS